MAKLSEIKTLPLLGLKNDVPADDISLMPFVSEGLYITYDTGGQNISYTRKRHATSKSEGYSAWSASATASPNRCTGLYELYDGTNRDQLMFESGRLFYFA